MVIPSHVRYLIIGAGIHGLSTAWGLAKRLKSKGEVVEGVILLSLIKLG